MIKQIKLQNIRVFPNNTFEFDPGVNLVIGPNGAGKTTILEAITFFAFGKFFSVSPDSMAVSDTESVGRLEVLTDKGKASVAITPKEKIAKVYDNKIPNSQLIGFEKAVLFNPETVELICASPDVRRREIDLIIAQNNPNFVIETLQYRKVLKQRNSLLKTIAAKRAGEEELEFWDSQLRELSLKIVGERKAFLDEINGSISQIHGKFSSRKGELKIIYRDSADYDRFQEALQAMRESDIAGGSTSIGPHRDDFYFEFNGRSLRDHASRGEQRLAALALKLEEVEYLSAPDCQPLLVLDDVFSELDEGRRTALTGGLRDKKNQIIISATDDQMIPESLKQNAHLINLSTAKEPDEW